MEGDRRFRMAAVILAMQWAFGFASPSQGYRTVIRTVPVPINQDDLFNDCVIPPPRHLIRNADFAPDFSQTDVHGNLCHLNAELQKGPVVLIFYRGRWCDSCLLQLRQIQQKLGALERLGATVIAIAPQNQQLTLLTESTNRFCFPLLVDRHNKIAKTYGLTYRLDERTKALYALCDIKLNEINDDSGEELSLPATYVIDTTGSVVYFYQNYDYRMRAPLSEVLRAVKRCRKH